MEGMWKGSEGDNSVVEEKKGGDVEGKGEEGKVDELLTVDDEGGKVEEMFCLP